MDIKHYIRIAIAVKLLLMLTYAHRIRITTKSEYLQHWDAFSVNYGEIISSSKYVDYVEFKCNKPYYESMDKHECYAAQTAYYIAYTNAVILVILTAINQPNSKPWKIASRVTPVVAGIFILIMLGVTAHAATQLEYDPPVKLAPDGFIYALWMVVLCGAYIGLTTTPTTTTREPLL